MNLAGIDSGLDLGFNSSRWSPSSPEYRRLVDMALADEQDSVMKSLTTGSGIVADGATGGQALRMQWLHGLMEMVSFEEEDAVGIKEFPITKAYSTTAEWSTMDSYGGGGDGFVPETGSDGAFGVDYADDAYTRQTQSIKFMAEARQVSIVAEAVRNIESPMSTSRKGTARALLGKANLALYHGDARTDSRQFNSIKSQIRDWVTRYPSDQVCLYDAGGNPIDKYLLEDLAIVNRNVYGKGNRLLMSTTAYGDSQKLLWPQARQDEGSDGAQGGNRRDFKGPNGNIRLVDDPMLRANQPLRVDGPGSNGDPKTTADSGALAFASNPFVAASSSVGCQATTPGTGNFWQFASLNTDTGLLAKPAVPSGPGNQGNRLDAGIYYYGISAVYKGFESALYIYGAGSQSAAAVSGTPTGLTVTSSNKIVQIEIDVTSITGLGSTYPKANVKFRVYRTAALTSAPTLVSQFVFLGECGIPTSGNARFDDNGYFKPGTDNAFLITTVKNGNPQVNLLQLLPVMERQLPNLPLADPLLMLWFQTPVLWVPRRHIVVRNVGRSPL